MSPDRYSTKAARPSKPPEHRVTRAASRLAVNTSAHMEHEDRVANTITQLGVLARGLDLHDEGDARIYARRIDATLIALTPTVVQSILAELGDPSTYRTMGERIAAVQAIVVARATAY